MISKLHIAGEARLNLIRVDNAAEKLREAFDILRDQHLSNILKLSSQPRLSKTMSQQSAHSGLKAMNR